jgi:hypothetical protein
VPVPSPSVPVGKVGKPKSVSIGAPRTYSSLSATDLEVIRSVASPRQLMDIFGVSDTTAYKWHARAQASPSPSNGRPTEPEDGQKNLLSDDSATVPAEAVGQS